MKKSNLTKFATRLFPVIMILVFAATAAAQMPEPFRIMNLESRSISAGNPTGERGGVPEGTAEHWKKLPAGQKLRIADIAGPGMIRSMWFTIVNKDPISLRSYIIRIYWDGSKYPSVEAPFGDFFGLAYGRAAHFYTPFLGVSEGKGFNCLFPMPFAKQCVIEIENDSPKDEPTVFYQIHYTLGDNISPDMGYFHAHFRRDTPPRGKPFRILEVQNSGGVFVGMNISALPRHKGTWREGDFRFYFDGDKKATIVGTGWSDWFLSGWGLGIHQSAYAGSSYQVDHPEFKDKYFCSSYRFHVLDPIYFRTGLIVEHDQRGHTTYVEIREDDWNSTVYWYQHLNGIALPPLPSREERIRGIEVQDWEIQSRSRK